MAMAETKSPDLDEILQILRRRNLVHTEKWLLDELNEEQVSSEYAAAAERDGQFRSTAYTPNCNLALCFDEYERYLKWAIASEPEELRAEACALLFPLFCHVCIDLLSAGRVPKFRAFVKRFASEQMPFYARYVSVLENLKDGNALADCKVVSLLRTNHFVQSLTAQAEEAIGAVLKHLCTLKAILHSHVHIVRRQQAPRTMDEAIESFGYLLGEAPSWINDRTVHLGIYRFQPDQAALERVRLCTRGANASATFVYEHCDDQLVTVVPEADAPPLDRIPLPPLSHDDQLNHLLAVVDAENCRSLENGSVPSIFFYTILDQSGSTCCVDLTDDCELIATGNSDCSVSIYPLSPDSVAAMKMVAPNGWSRFSGHSGIVHGVSWQRDKRLLLSCSSDATCKLWQPAAGRLLNTFRTGSSILWDVEFAPMGGYFAVGSSAGVAILYSLVREQPCRIFQGHHDSVNRLQFHPNTNYLVTASGDRSARLWDLRNGQCVRLFTGPKSDLTSVTFSHDGRRLAMGTDTGHVLFMDIGQGSQMHSMSVSSTSISSLAYSMNNEMIAIGALDEQITLRSLNSDTPASYQFPTKSTTMLHVQFTRRNLLLGFGHVAVSGSSKNQSQVLCDERHTVDTMKS